MTIDVAAVLNGTGAEVVRGRPSNGLTSGGLARADLAQALMSVTVDSRTAEPGSLFVALRGERTDGHEFIGDALKRGSAACLVSRIPDEKILRQAPANAHEIVLLVVPDTLSALQRLATYWRLRHDIPVVGITGSIGKTTTKEIVASVLSAQCPVLRSEANFNTEIGLPLTLLRLEKRHEIAVLEMGMHVPGDIAVLVEISRPTVGIVTNVAPIHLERCTTLERIARGKSEMVAGLQPDGLAVVNGDDPWTRAMTKSSGVSPIVWVGIGTDCDFRAEDIQTIGLKGVRFTLRAEGRRFSIRTRVPGVHTVHAFLFAAAVARSVGMAWCEIQAAMEDVRLETRQRIVHLRCDNVVLIDDTYNASPPSMRAALDVLASGTGVKIAVLGDMLELGPDEEAAHIEIGQEVARAADWLVARGERGAWIGDGAERAGMETRRIVRAATNADALHAVASLIRGALATGAATSSPKMRGSWERSKDANEWTVLVKGSRGMGMEEVVSGLIGASSC